MTPEIWTETCAELCIECAAAHKRSLGTFILSLGVILCHTLRGIFIPTAKVLSASSDLTDVHSGEPNPFSKCRRVFGLVGHFCDALGIPRATMYGMYADIREGNMDPNALIRASPSTIAACGRWLEILRTRVCGSFAPEHRSGRTSFVGPTQVCVYTDASEEGLCGFCHGYFFKVRLSRRWAALPMAVLEFVAFFGSVIAFGHMIRGFKVSLLTDSTAVRAIANRGAARSELMQMVHTRLLDAPEFQALAQSARISYITTEANAISDAGTRLLLASRFVALCEQAGVRSRPLAVPMQVQAMLDSLWALATDVVARAPPRPAAPTQAPPTSPTASPATTARAHAPAFAPPHAAPGPVARINPPSPAAGVRFGEASHPGPVELCTLAELEATAGVQVVGLPSGPGMPRLIGVIMPDNTHRLFTADRIRPGDAADMMYGGTAVPSSFAAASITPWLNEASGFTLRLVTFSSYGEDAATWVDYDALDNPVMPPSWMWARFSEDRDQVNIGFREPHSLLPDSDAGLFGPMLLANRRIGRRRELIRPMRTGEPILYPGTRIRRPSF
jgi:hypothetical protein